MASSNKATLSSTPDFGPSFYPKRTRESATAWYQTRTQNYTAYNTRPTAPGGRVVTTRRQQTNWATTHIMTNLKYKKGDKWPCRIFVEDLDPKIKLPPPKSWGCGCGTAKGVDFIEGVTHKKNQRLFFAVVSSERFNQEETVTKSAYLYQCPQAIADVNKKRKRKCAENAGTNRPVTSCVYGHVCYKQACFCCCVHGALLRSRYQLSPPLCWCTTPHTLQLIQVSICSLIICSKFQSPAANYVPCNGLVFKQCSCCFPLSQAAG